MVFASPIFLFLFLPLVFLLYGAALVLIRHGLARRQLRNVVLLAASIVFYTWGEASYIYLILAAIVFNWTVGLAIENMTSTALRRCCLAIGVCGDLSVLAYMKYTNFAVANSNILLSWIGLRSLAIPGRPAARGLVFYISRDFVPYRHFAQIGKSRIKSPELCALYPAVPAAHRRAHHPLEDHFQPVS
jgi:alginate O-acetyltransferase complex protein AlgI